MRKIMFNDRYGLTEAVLAGRKTMTRRSRSSCFEVGEIVAVAQSLRDMGYDPSKKDWGRGIIWSLDHTPQWTNKMFVSASECIHQIRITDVRVERLQDISDEDCLREGIVKDDSKMCFNGYAFDYLFDQHGNMLASCWYKTPREAFSALIDKVSGKGTWEANPWVCVYEFELVK